MLGKSVVVHWTSFLDQCVLPGTVGSELDKPPSMGKATPLTSAGAHCD